MNARTIIEAETPKDVFKSIACQNLKGLSVDRIKSARAEIAARYGTLDHTAVELEAASIRTGSEHEETELNGRVFCQTCGYVDSHAMRLPDPIYHPEWWL